jgi:hypothetical protein
MDPVKLNKLDPVKYCRHMHQKAYAGQRMAKVVHGQKEPKRKSEYLIALEQGEAACRALKERDMQMANYLNIQISPLGQFWRSFHIWWAYQADRCFR